MRYTITRISDVGSLTLADANGDAVKGYHRESVDYDRQACGPLKVGDILERDPDKLVAFIRVGDFDGPAIDPEATLGTNADGKRAAAEAETKRQPTAFDLSAEKRAVIQHLATSRERLRDAMACLSNAGACVMPDDARAVLQSNRDAVLAAIAGIEAHLARLGWLA